MARGRRIVVDSSDDEFPELQDITSFGIKAYNKSAGASITAPNADKQESKGAIRRRKLGVIADNSLLRPLSDRGTSTPAPKGLATETKKSTTPQRVELRTRKTKPIITSVEIDDNSEPDSVQEETIIEDFSEDDESGSNFEGSESCVSDDDDSILEQEAHRSLGTARKKSIAQEYTAAQKKRSPSPSAQLIAEALAAEERFMRQAGGNRKGKAGRKASTEKTEASSSRSSSEDLVDPLTRLRIHELPPPKTCNVEPEIPRSDTSTPPPYERTYKGLVSPSKKIPRIPTTPHHPQTDTFWNQEFIDEWNDEHSPKKQLFPPLTAKSKSPYKRTSNLHKKSEPSQAALQKAAKKAFSDSKHEVAENFLHELDERITDGKLSELAAGTGGIRIEWSNKLNTTAGRANWKRETIRSKMQDAGVSSTVRYRHHASIELSTKVIDDTHRLLNVVAHEFCHLANFMISGITNNPHGREFKAWASRVTQTFGEDRGIEVTTKHTYDIDFRYVWECTTCGLEFKRHSKSINPERHRCGACKSELRQTKPAPRARPSKESEYQRFMKEQMRVIRAENPGSPQKDIMKIVASRWSGREKDAADRLEDAARGPSSSSVVAALGLSLQNGDDKTADILSGMSQRMNNLAVVDLT